ncbi:hypothetical protein BH23VER1_BH23VER1_12620 [soil metagenome]
MSESSSKSSSSTVLAFFIGLCALVVAIAGAIYFLVSRPAVSLKRSLADAITQITGAKTVITGNSIEIATKDVAELALVSRQQQTIIKHESSVLGSSSVLILRGEFNVKAGFDLDDDHSITIDQTSGEISVDFPPAKILSVELRDYEVFYSEEGIFSKLTPEIQQAVTNQMLLQARLDAEKSDIKKEAESRLATRLRDLLGPQSKDLTLDGAPLPIEPLP